MKAELISVGTELLLGDILNTNAQYLSKELAALGITVHHQCVIGDNTAGWQSWWRRQSSAAIFCSLPAALDRRRTI